MTGLTVEVTKGAAPIAFLIAGIVALLTSYSYLGLTRRFPGEDGTVDFVNRAFGDGIVTGAANILLLPSYVVLLPIYAYAFGSYGAALSIAIALIVLCLAVDENPATRRHPWILAGMIAVSFVIEITYRRITGCTIRLHHKDGPDASPGVPQPSSYLGVRKMRPEHQPQCLCVRRGTAKTHCVDLQNICRSMSPSGARRQLGLSDAEAFASLPHPFRQFERLPRLLVTGAPLFRGGSASLRGASRP